jgi:hypothetical protein
MYYNNNYYRDYANWQRAAQHQAMMLEMQQRAHNENLRRERDLRSGQPGFLGARGTMLGEIAAMYNQITPLEHMANQHRMNMMNAAAHAMNNEMVQVQDRRMDLADMEQQRKVAQTEYERQVAQQNAANEKAQIEAQERMNTRNAEMKEKMNERNNQGLDNAFGNLNDSVADLGNGNGPISDPFTVPDYTLYDNYDNKIGGGSYFSKALLS